MHSTAAAAMCVREAACRGAIHGRARYVFVIEGMYYTVTAPLTCSLTHSLTHSLSNTHTYTQTYTPTNSLIHCRTRTHTCTHAHMSCTHRRCGQRGSTGWPRGCHHTSTTAWKSRCSLRPKIPSPCQNRLCVRIMAKRRFGWDACFCIEIHKSRPQQT